MQPHPLQLIHHLAQRVVSFCKACLCSIPLCALPSWDGIFISRPKQTLRTFLSQREKMLFKQAANEAIHHLVWCCSCRRVLWQASGSVYSHPGTVLNFVGSCVAVTQTLPIKCQPTHCECKMQPYSWTPTI